MAAVRVEDQICGPFREGYQSFCLLSCNICQEYSVNFGLLDLDGSPQRNFAAYAFAVQCLSGKRYIGELAAPPRKHCTREPF